ncbi:hypothetical protein SAMN05216388_100332 [Halorientalis persicus]|jgi:uncharacterized membrane protein YdcZ (DUF606 family)|uniref:Uncharacterized protein n=2 Tax=Halorientalis persicus TaxID=1367881 RepID=A0A1H8G8W0_9EURY|nr:hypothetical protein SAMN05216388_100332 [Halorientalis persicus]
MGMEPLVATPSFAVPLRLVVGVVAGTIATFAMDGVMTRLPEGMTPPLVAAGVLTDRRPGDAHPRLAAVAHYLAGGASGPLYVTLLLFGEALLGVSVSTYLFTAAVMYLAMVGFFTVVVLPQARGLGRSRIERIRLDWALSAAAYLAILVPLVAIGSGYLQ